MKDFFGKEIAVGDTVAFNEPGYKWLTKGEVVKINKKMLRIKYLPHHDYNRSRGIYEETNEYPTDCIVEPK